MSEPMWKVVYNPSNLTLVVYERYGVTYEIDLERATNETQVLDWIYHIAATRGCWSHGLVGAVVRALTEVTGPERFTANHLRVEPFTITPTTRTSDQFGVEDHYANDDGVITSRADGDDLGVQSFADLMKTPLPTYGNADEVLAANKLGGGFVNADRIDGLEGVTP